jgi:hypothetical protein
MTVVLEGMSPAQEQGWLVLLDLFPNRAAPTGPSVSAADGNAERTYVSLSTRR